MKRVPWLCAALGLLLAAGCAQNPVPRSSKPIIIEMVALRVQVAEYQPDAMWERYPDKTTATFDATRLRLLAPPDMAGKELLIYHQTPPPADSPWRKTGAIYELDVERLYLFPPPGVLRYDIFSDGHPLRSRR